MVVALDSDDYGHCIELIETYADLGLGMVDASIVTVAERLGITTFATLNRRDFTVVRSRLRRSVHPTVTERPVVDCDGPWTALS